MRYFCHLLRNRSSVVSTIGVHADQTVATKRGGERETERIQEEDTHLLRINQHEIYWWRRRHCRRASHRPLPPPIPTTAMANGDGVALNETNECANGKGKFHIRTKSFTQNTLPAGTAIAAVATSRFMWLAYFLVVLVAVVAAVVVGYLISHQQQCDTPAITCDHVRTFLRTMRDKSGAHMTRALHFMFGMIFAISSTTCDRDTDTHE